MLGNRSKSKRRHATRLSFDDDDFLLYSLIPSNTFRFLFYNSSNNSSRRYPYRWTKCLDTTILKPNRAKPSLFSSPLVSSTEMFPLRLFCMSKAGSQYAKRLTCGNCGKETYVNPVHVPSTTLRHSNCVWSDLKKRWDRVSTWSSSPWKGGGDGWPVCPVSHVQTRVTYSHESNSVFTLTLAGKLTPRARFTSNLPHLRAPLHKSA